MATPLFSLAAQALPSLFSAFQRNAPAAPQAPATGRAALIEESKRLGDFEAKKNAYNQQALAMGSPTMMDDDGNIVQREINPTDIMRMTAQTSGGNTVSMRPDVQARLMAMAPTYRTSGAADEQLFQAMKREMDEQNRRAAAGVKTMAPGVDVMTGKYGTGFAAPIGAVPSNMAAVLQKAREDEILSAGGMPETETIVAPTNIGKSLSSVLTQAWDAERAKRMAGGEKKEEAKPAVSAPVKTPTSLQTYSGINDTPGAASNRLRELILKQTNQSPTKPQPAVGSLAARNADKERRAAAATLRPVSQLLYDTGGGGTPMSPLQFAMTNLYPGDDEQVLAQKYGINVGSQAGLIPAAADILNQLQPRIKEEQGARQAKEQAHWEKQLSTLSPQAMEIVKRVASGGQQGKTMSESEFNATNFLPGLDTLGFKTVFGGMPSNMTDYATIQALADAYRRSNPSTAQK